MSYQVLARKWRPRVFAEMVGQEHVLRALINALDNNRLHHAYLFTGTRGVGKTTVARILAKCLNCETGVTSTPCGECASCREIAEGRFVDLIEVDAASRTKVEDTRELLENVQYAPTRGRYKIYLIDEVHMLSGHSFNALLKTLEEPPPHIKFLLATTDPQKLPVTVLSRCLQFNLKNLGADRIVQHLGHVLGEEKVPAEEAGLWSLARAADGSMRDALSLTDQAVAHGGGKITEHEVAAMLGTIERRFIIEICESMAHGDGKAVLADVARMADQAPDYDSALADLLGIWHQVAVAQSVPEALDNGVSHYQEILQLATQVSREDVQLFYQICLLGRRDIDLAPDLRAGFEMVLLRALAFRPQTEPSPDEKPREAVSPIKKPEMQSPATNRRTSRTLLSEKSIDSVVKPKVPDSVVATEYSSSIEQPEPATSKSVLAVNSSGPNPDSNEKICLDRFQASNWTQVFRQLPLNGVLREVASDCVFLQQERGQLNFLIDRKRTSLYDSAHQQRLAQFLSEYFGQPVTVTIDFGVPAVETPRAAEERQQRERREKARQLLFADPGVQRVMELFDAKLDENSIRATDQEQP